MKSAKLGFFLIAFLMGTLIVFGQGQDSIRAVNGVLTINLVPSSTRYKVFVDQTITSTVITNPIPAAVITVLFVQDATGHTVAFGGNIAGVCSVVATASATTGCQFTFDSANNQWTGLGTPGGSSGLLGTTVSGTADWRQAATDGTCANSSTAISWGTANEITTADVGKVIDIVNPSGNGWNSPSKTTISTVNQAAKTGTISQNTNASNCGTPVTFIVYTDNAATFNAAELAIHNSASHQGILYYPCGTYGVASAIWNQSGGSDSISYWGGGGGHTTSTVGPCTVFKISPAVFTAVGGTGLPAMAPASGDIRDITMDGEGVVVNVSNGNLLTFSGVNDVSNFQMTNFLGTQGANGNLVIVSSNNFQARNFTATIKDMNAVDFNSRQSNVLNGYFSGSPGIQLAACYCNFFGGLAGLFISSGTSSAISTSGGAGSVQARFFGTQLNNGTTGNGSTINLTNPSAHTIEVALIDPNFNCQGTSGVPIITTAATTILSWTGRGAISPSEGTLGCPGTLAITNAGTFIDGGGIGFGLSGNTVSWSGAGTYFLNPSSFNVAPTLTGTGACATITTQSGGVAGQATCTGTTGASTFILSSLAVAPHGWNCSSSDVTHTLAGTQSAVTTTGCTITLSSVTTNDVITFAASPF